MEDLKTIGSKVIVEIDKEDFKEENGLYLPTKDKRQEMYRQKEKRNYGKSYNLHMRDATVVSVGEKTKYLNKGDKTRVNIYNGQVFDYKGHRYVSLEEVDTELVVL